MDDWSGFSTHDVMDSSLMVTYVSVQQYWSDASKPYRFVPVSEFAEHFKNFSMGRKIKEDLATPPPATPLGGTKHYEPEVNPFLY
jgi:hypothetical protein